MNIKSMLGACGLIGMLAASPAWSIPIETVGGIDQLIDSTNLGNSGDAVEESWVAGVLGLSVDDLIYEAKSDVTGSDWELVTGTFAGVYAFELTDSPDWFLIKTGNIAGQTDRHFLFANVPSLEYAVIRLLDLGITQILNIDKISHVGEFEGPEEVPEPASLALFGVGLLGLGLMKRKGAKKA